MTINGQRVRLKVSIKRVKRCAQAGSPAGRDTSGERREPPAGLQQHRTVECRKPLVSHVASLLLLHADARFRIRVIAPD